MVIWMVDITPLVQAVIVVCSIAITGYLIPWFKRKFNASDTEDFMKWVEIAVLAAEQLYSSTQGDAKKQYVVNFLKQHYTIDEDIIENAIEGTVKSIHASLKEGSADESR